jgi:hypothetical protein
MQGLPAFMLVAALALVPAAAAAGPAVKHTSSGTAAAKASLLTSADLGKGWTSKATTQSGIQVSCTGYQPNGNGITEIGVASSPSFSASSAGPFVVQETSVYASAAQAKAYWKRALTAGLIACTKQSLSPLAKQGIKVKVVSAGGLPVQQVTPMTAGYRVVATLSSPANKNLKTYLDWVFVGNGKTVTQIVISSFQKLPAKYEYALAILANEHMTPKQSLPTA